MGIGAAGVTVSSLTMITDLTNLGNRGKGMGLFDFSNIGGYAAGVLVGGGLHTYFASQLGYAFAATGGGVAAAPLFFPTLLRGAPKPIKREGVFVKPPKGLGPRRQACVTLLCAAAAGVG